MATRNVHKDGYTFYFTNSKIKKGKYTVWSKPTHNHKIAFISGYTWKEGKKWNASIIDLLSESFNRLTSGEFRQYNEIPLSLEGKTRQEAGLAVAKAYHAALQFHKQAPIRPRTYIQRSYWTTRCHNEFEIRQEHGLWRLYCKKDSGRKLLAEGTCKETLESLMNSNDGNKDHHGNSDPGLDFNIIRKSLEEYYAQESMAKQKDLYEDVLFH